MNTKLTVKKLKLLKETLRDLTARNAGEVKGRSPVSKRCSNLECTLGFRCGYTLIGCPPHYTKKPGGC